MAVLLLKWHYRKQNVHWTVFFQEFFISKYWSKAFSTAPVRPFLKNFLKEFVHQLYLKCRWNVCLLKWLFVNWSTKNSYKKRDTHGKLPVLKIIRFICCRPGSVEKTTYLHFMSVQERRRCAMYEREILTTLAIFEKLKCSNTQKCFREKRLSVICWFITFEITITVSPWATVTSLRIDQ